MGLKEFTNTLRHWDNRSSQWFIRHFYLLFFEFILVAILVAVFINSIQIININADLNHSTNATVLDRLMQAQTFNTLLIVILLLFNSFWMLYIFNSLLRLRTLLKNIDFNISKNRGDTRPRNAPPRNTPGTTP